MADPGQWQQIVMNLCINAADAMERRGTVQVGLERATLESDDNSTEGFCLTVTDSGHGIPAEVQKRMFMPFFTTKAPNEGSGLGLSVIYGIVNSLGGEIEVSSHTEGPERGTQFRIKVPSANAETNRQ
ncbi:MULTISPECIES: sensor histidine kinase, partial [Methylomonas]|uniref:histidine kinase n=2 Tax=Methylomonas TaxID=416 RepID=A0A126T557_9GAMM